METIADLAVNNLNLLRENPYPGRGIVLGKTQTGDEIIQVYWLMGRSDNSRNRVLEAMGGEVRTRAADPVKLLDPALVIYTAMRELPGRFMVSNGDHTDTLWDGIQQGATFEEALKTRVHEPDDPNWTPRIAGEIRLNGREAAGCLAVISADPFNPQRSIHHFYHYGGFQGGYGWCVTTYRGDGNPLPSFQGEPLLIPLYGDMETIADSLWEVLNPENRIALVVKQVNPATGKSTVTLRNRYTAVD
ncbi:MAG: IMP cyclohydrolase [Deltaproteobacteria bacterium]|nr:IMP cyclohydrolase [Deltaproteobacteria bacterium]